MAVFEDEENGGRRPRPFRPFRSHEEYLYAMKEDLAEWLQNLYDLPITADDFMDKLETGVALCRHANRVISAAKRRGRTLGEECRGDVVYRPEVQPGTFHARDNVHNFIAFCRKGLRIKECLLFETDDLVMRKNEKNVVLCLLEVARRGTKFGMPAPLLVQMEREIDAEIAAHRDDSNEENRTPPSSLSLRGDSDEGHEADDDSESEPLATPRQPQAPQPQIVTNDLRSLHERGLFSSKSGPLPEEAPAIPPQTPWKRFPWRMLYRNGGATFTLIRTKWKKHVRIRTWIGIVKRNVVVGQKTKITEGNLEHPYGYESYRVRSKGAQLQNDRMYTIK
ncbi:GAS2-like protein pickled eggs [Caerostris extrusa]|uniref:GAS2-like protein pickled eggs n=1 Tax=Caerostris extrusa TaxID=172846 RepID=A0AAV4RW76_CAEEX|nr:GAS2-like protein pickled eggs [Caerostris extrusa]